MVYTYQWPNNNELTDFEEFSEELSKVIMELLIVG